MVLLPKRAFNGALTVALISVTIASCAGGSAGGEAERIDLSGDYLSSPLSSFTLVPDTAVRMNFEDNRMSVSAGCNTMFGQFQLDDSQLRVSPLASTMIGCPEALSDQDRRLDEFLTGGPIVSASDDGFTLTDTDETTLVMVTREVADPDRPLTGVNWRLESITQADAVVSAVGFDSVAVTFGPETVQVTTPCADGQADYTVLEDGNLTTGELSLVPSAQPDPQICGPASGVVEAESALVELFGGTVEVANDASTVSLTGNGVTVTLRAQ